jgi:hypothetical protein
VVVVAERLFTIPITCYLGRRRPLLTQIAHHHQCQPMPPDFTQSD